MPPPKKQSKPAAARAALAANSATVILNLTAFQPATSGLCTLGDSGNLPPLSIVPGGSGIDYIGGVPGVDGIVVKKKNVSITFGIYSTTGDLYSFAGLAIVGLPTGGVGNPDPVGSANFSLQTWTQSQLTMKAHGANKGASWELYVLIINSKGVLGLIDPDIENDATDLDPGH